MTILIGLVLTCLGFANYAVDRDNCRDPYRPRFWPAAAMISGVWITLGAAFA